jgi:hypothetical protein
MRKKNILTFGAGCLAAAFPAYLAFVVAGRLGVAVLGLLFTFIAYRLEIEKEGPVGEHHTGLYAESQPRRDSISASERAATQAEIAANLKGIQMAKVIGVVRVLSSVVCGALRQRSGAGVSKSLAPSRRSLRCRFAPVGAPTLVHLRGPAILHHSHVAESTVGKADLDAPLAAGPRQGVVKLD